MSFQQKKLHADFKTIETKEFVTEVVKTKLDEDLVMETTIVDGEITNQRFEFVGDWKSRFPQVDPDYHEFMHFSDNSFLESDKCFDLMGSDELHEHIYKHAQSFITEREDYLGLDHIISFSLLGDGIILCLGRKKPVERWVIIDYIYSQIDDAKYDLDKTLVALKNCSLIKNPKIVEIPHYNRFEGEMFAIEYEMLADCVNEIEKEEIENIAKNFAVEK